MFKFTRFYMQQTAYVLFNQTKRYKGHSKWQNIKHGKGILDAERSAMFNHYAKRMKIIALEGKSANPNVNLQLAQIIEEAKKRCMPVATINGVLEKIENSKLKTQSELLDFRGPGNSLFVLRLLTDNLKHTKIVLNTIFKKNSAVVTEGRSLNAFHHQGFVLTEIIVDLDTATNDAITVGAEDVEEVEEDGKVYRFVCEPTHLGRVSNHLKQLNYKIIKSDEDFIPRSTVSLDDNELEKVDALCARLSGLEEVVTINHNIDLPEFEEEAVKIDSKR